MSVHLLVGLNMVYLYSLFLLLLALALGSNAVAALQLQNHPQPALHREQISRRSWLSRTTGSAALLLLVGSTGAVLLSSSDPAQAAQGAGPPPDLKFTESPSGLQYSDAKVGTGQPITQKGSPVTIDYVMSTTGARYGTKIYSSVDTNVPYRFKVGDGTTIAGIEQAIVGGDGVEPMRPGGIRRVIIPSKLGYEALAGPKYNECQEGKGFLGPITPVSEGTTGEYYQRFKNIYCNPNRPYQPDLVMDIKLYGKR